MPFNAASRYDICENYSLNVYYPVVLIAGII